jgi:hypothetical protein
VLPVPRQIPLFDRTLPKPFWTDQLRDDEVAVLASDRADVCAIFPSVDAARQWAVARVDADPVVTCEIYDRRGKAAPPLETIVHPSTVRVPSAAAGRRKIAWGWVCLVVSPLLIYLDWRNDLLLILPSLVGLQLIAVGLRLLYWGYSERAAARDHAGEGPSVAG